MLRQIHRPAAMGLLLVAAVVLGACAPSNAAPLPTAGPLATAAVAAPTVEAGAATAAVAAGPTVQAGAATAEAMAPTVEAAVPTVEAAAGTAAVQAAPTVQAGVGTVEAAAPTVAAEAGTAVASAVSGSTVQVANNATLGAILVDSKGMTLYIFKKDSPGKSVCEGGCAKIWPPLTVPQGTTPTAAAGVSGKLGVIQRTDGTYQVTYNDMPLYLYGGDTAPGQANGQGLQNVWYVVPAGPAGAATPAATSAASSGY